jgi:hypothetical protein
MHSLCKMNTNFICNQCFSIVCFLKLISYIITSLSCPL